MNGEQKGGVKNHFQTLFKIIKKKLQKEEEKEKEEKQKEEKKRIKLNKDKVIVYAINRKTEKRDVVLKTLNTNVIPKKVKMVEPKVVQKITKNVKNNKVEQIATKPVANNKIKAPNLINNNYKKTVKRRDKDIVGIVSNNNQIKRCVTTYEDELKQKNKNKLENSILKRINKIILDDKNDINSLKYKLYEIDKAIYSANDREQLDKLKKQFEIISDKIKKIKRDFEIIKESRYFEDYDQIENCFLIEEIDDFKFDNDWESIEFLSIKCKQQIESLEDIVIMCERAVDTSKKINKQNDQVKYFEDNTEIMNEQTNEMELISKKINDNIILQSKFIEDMNKKIGESQKNVKVYYKFKGLNELANNSLLIGLGMYNFPRIQKGRFRGLRFLIGSFLMYNSIRGMLKFLSPEMKKVTYIRYKDYTKELETESSRITFTHNLLNHSIKDISLLKSEFKDKFMEYQYQLPDYDVMFEKINKIEQQLKLQKKELINIDKNLELQKQKNKEYVKKIEKIEETLS